MSENQNLGRPAREDEEFESGQTNTSQGNFPDRQMEAQPGVFESGRAGTLGGVPELEDVPSDELERYGDSRPDRTDPDGAHFDDISEDPRMTTIRDPRDQPVVQKEDPAFLEKHRVDQDDEWVAQPRGPEFDQEQAVLRPRVSKKGDESEQL